MRIKLSKSWLFIALFFSSTGWAYDIVGPGKITFLENGWYDEGLAIHMDTGIAGCPAADNDFGLTADTAMFREIAALAMTGFASSVDVQLVVEAGTCVFGDRTKVLSVRLIK